MKQKIGIFYICGIDIGNSKDISQRLLDLLKITENILVEDIDSFNLKLKDLGLNKKYNIFEYKTGTWPNEIFLNSSIIFDILKSGKDVLYIAKRGMPKTDQMAGNIVVRVLSSQLPTRVIPGPDLASTVMSISGLGYGNGYMYLDIMNYNENDILQTLKNTSIIRESTIIRTHCGNAKKILNMLVTSGYSENVHASIVANVGMENQIINAGPIPALLKFVENNIELSEEIFFVIGGNNPPPKISDEYLKNNEGFHKSYIKHNNGDIVNS
jgi:16S rRNA C1402 (ribose-2'-O) methylase RsmI